jgi:sulfatase-modifying factor enzyme 1
MTRRTVSLAAVALAALGVAGCNVSEAAPRVDAAPGERAAAREVTVARPVDAQAVFATIGGRHHAESFTWRSVAGAHWQIDAFERESFAATDAREGTRGQCGPGMVHVHGAMKTHVDPGAIEAMQLDHCSVWINKSFPERCQTFDAARWAETAASLATAAMDFCIDRFEFPNVAGQYPMVLVSAIEAKDLCAAEGKRLCTEDEWTFACEGEEARPYSYGTGFERDPDACITDRNWRPFDESAMFPRDGDRAAREMDRVWQGRASGSQPRCKSSFGVYDMVGNIDEWTTSSRGDAPKSVLKGGYWGPIRSRCRPSTRRHGELHRYYQQGFRCCSPRG